MTRATSQIRGFLPVLLYHHVGLSHDSRLPALTVTRDLFRKHVQWLARNGYVTVTLGQCVDWLENGIPIPPKAVLLTFDDAYEDICEHALPVLLEHSFTAAIFVVTGELGGSNRWDREKRTVARRLMSAGQIRQWSELGMEFGAHSRTHPDLTRIDPRRLENEVSGSAADLSDVMGRPVHAFAYPYGSLNRRAVECVQATYRIAFSTERGVNRNVRAACLLQRSMVQPWDHPSDLRWRLGLGWRPMEWLRYRLREAQGAIPHLLSLGSCAFAERVAFGADLCPPVL